jgi:hypothetical protein
MATYKKINQLEEAAKRLNTAGTELGNMTYDNFKTGNAYKGLQRDYQQGGQMAMKDTLGQVAARTGGMASSYATSAANQSYNNYMQGLESAARSLFNDEYSRAKDKYNTARDEYNTAYGEYRDAVGDERYKTEWDYKVGRDQLADERYNDTQKKEAVKTQKGELYNLIISGGTPNRADFPDLTDADWNTITATATNTYNSTNKEDYLASVKESAAAGMLPAFDPNNKWGVTIDEFKNALGLGEADYKNSAGYLSNQKATDDSIRSMLTSESFDWDTYDWNGDAEGLGSAADYFAGKGSAYDSGYWQGIYNDAQQGYADADIEAAQEEVYDILEAGGEPPIDLLIKAGWLEEITPANEGETPNYDSDGNGIPDGLSGLAATMWQNNINSKNDAEAQETMAENVRDIEARIANGESLEDIKKAYGIVDEFDENDDPQGKNGFTWEEVTGKSLAEWTKKFNDNTAKNYSYQDTEAGRAEIVGKLIDSGTLSLSAKDQSNFDYIFGTGAYTEVKRLIDNIGAVQLDGADTINTQTNAYIDDEVEAIANRFPTFSSEQIYALLEKANPDVFRVWADEMVRD